MIDKNKIQIFTDGACKGNPGIGGWGVLIKYPKISDELKAVSYTHLTLPTNREV